MSLINIPAECTPDHPDINEQLQICRTEERNYLESIWGGRGLLDRSFRKNYKFGNPSTNDKKKQIQRT